MLGLSRTLSRPVCAAASAALVAAGLAVSPVASAAPVSTATAPTTRATATSSTSATTVTATAPAVRFRGETQSGSFTSRYWPGRTVHWQAALPVGTPKATVIVLHGRSDDGAKAFYGLDLPGEARRTGMAIVTVDGGDNYWTRHGGIDTNRMVTSDLMRAIAARGIPVKRYALSGYSMGGLGSLLVAQRMGGKRVFAVAPMSSALWQDRGGVEGAAQAKVRRQASKLRGIPVRMVCGTGDVLLDVNKSMARLIPQASTSWTSGGHDFGYWRPVFADQLDWMARHA